jgi:hypothetical protein
MLKTILVAAAALSFVGLGACSKEGSAEKTGENIDSAIENATSGEKSLGDGPIEKAGESVDKATGHTDKDPVDAVGDAVDGNPATKP